MAGEERSYEPIELADLDRVAEVAWDRVVKLCHDRPRNQVYLDKLLVLALCQGAAEHFVRGRKGIKDFDVWAFFSPAAEPFPWRWRGCADLGPSKFGADPYDQRFTGRRIDVMGRGIPELNGRDPVASVYEYISRYHTQTAWYLRQQPVVMLRPVEHLGRILWDRA